MIRIYAPFVVAFMENTKFSGDRTEVNLPRHTMGLVRFSFNPYASISPTGYSSDPSPAFFYRGFINLIPESLFFWNTSIIVPMNEFVWFTLDSPISRIGMIGKFSFLTTPTLAIAVRNDKHGPTSCGSPEGWLRQPVRKPGFGCTSLAAFPSMI